MEPASVWNCPSLESTDVASETKVAKSASNALWRDISPIARWGMLHLVA